MFSPRTLIIAGIVLIAVALGPSGHGLWWLVGFIWFLPHARRNSCVGAAAPPPAEPDPTHDRHEAFPSS